jgi:ribonuclease D
MNYFFNDIPENFKLVGDLAIDTEAMGLKITRDRLCVIQICDEHNNVCLVHFPSGNFNYDCPNLKKILTDPSRQKIFHYGRFDIAIMSHYLGIELENVYCTKIASRLCRTYTDSHGLRSLIMDLLKVEIKKDQQSSNWGSEILTEPQKHYAANDVIHLHQLRKILNEMLRKNGRAEIAGEYFKFLLTVCKTDLLGFEEDLFRHM